ncbi:MAG: NADH:ubiquinone reductase (Na(+)-transporting) subunit C [Bacteroidales bacterium]|nr:NADH:ubiquinone reductase (Na(+)-transporting) subunit C [Bacteroidales bacterium]
MNRNSNVYTVIYAAVMVILVAAVLAFTALSLRPAQTKNIVIEKQSQILSSINIASTLKDAEGLYKKYIVETYVINSTGEKVDGNAFDINVKEEVSKPDNERLLPVFVASIDGSKKYIMPMYGMGLWGPIWGYISVDENGDTVYGAVFSHQGETAGLGAEITKPKFSDQFKGKNLFNNGNFASIAVLKAGVPSENQDSVDAISGGTITSAGVSRMLFDCLKPYESFLKSLK